MSNLPSQSKRSDTGAAIIIVLGMLAILLILASAFSVNMRIERTAAGNARFGVSTRHMLLAALARAIDDIDQNMTNAAGVAMYPAWDVIGTQGGVSGAQLAWGEAMQYMPAALTAQLQNAQCSWKEFPGARGRYAYLIANVSGFLDANEVGGVGRDVGADPEEICIGVLPEVASTSLFYAARSSDVRYETLKEFGELQQGTGLGSNAIPTNFVVYSRYPPGTLLPDGTVVTQLQCVAGDPTQILVDGPEPIEEAFRRSGLTDPQDEYAPAATINLIDFVDSDSLPASAGIGYNPDGPFGPYVDAFPMFNEVRCSNMVFLTTNAAGEYLYAAGYELEFECIYPFLSPTNPQGYEFYCEVTVSNSNQSANWHFEPGGGNPSVLPVQPINIDSDGYWVWTTADALAFDLRNSQSNSLPGSVTIYVRVDAEIKDSSGNIVDAVSDSAPLVVSLTHNLTTGLPSPGNPAVLKRLDRTRECIDPRRNWQGGFWAGETPTHTLGSNNAATVSFFAANDCDDDIWMYIKNEPLETVGELGCLFFGRTWETIRLYGDDYHTVLDNFTIDQNAGAVQKGMVNLGAQSRTVWDAVFTNMPIREFATPVPRITNDTALASLAAAITSGGPYTNLSDIGKADWRAATAINAITSSVTGPPFCEIDRESVIRNSSDMLGTRQNLFVVLLAAGPFRVSPGIAAFRGDWLGRSRAVALIWRDPFPDSDGNHPCFVRMFNVLKDE